MTKRLALIAIAALTLAGCGGGGFTVSEKALETTTTVAATTTSIATTTTEAPTTTTEVTTTTEPAYTMVDWATDNRIRIDDMIAAITDIQDGATMADIDLITAGCSDLVDLVREAQTVPAAPIPAINEPWQRSLTEFLIAGEACSTGDPTLLDFAADHIEKGAVAVGETTDAMESEGS